MMRRLFLLVTLIGGLWVQSLLAAVAENGTGTANANVSGATTASVTTFTVDASSTCLTAFLHTRQDVSSVSINWDAGGTPQAMTRVGTGVFQTSAGRMEIFRLDTPTTGNRTLTASWTTSSDAVLGAIAWSGSGSGCIAGGDTLTKGQASGSDNPNTIGPVTSTTDGATACGFVNETNNYIESGSTTPDAYYIDNATFAVALTSFALGGTSNTHTADTTTTNAYAAMCVHVVASSGASGPPPGSFSLLGVGR